MRLLDLFCGRWGWSKAFAARGWECVGVDLTVLPEIPEGCTFIQQDVMEVTADYCRQFDFICASSPCEQFSVHGMKHFHPNPPYPTKGIELFEHTRRICEESGRLYVMENVRAAQQFVGNARHHCGPFYLWGTGAPLLVNQGISKGWKSRTYQGKDGKWRDGGPGHAVSGAARAAEVAKVATIPPELANTVADYAERILEGVIV